MNDAEYIAAIAEFYKDGPSPEFRAHYERLMHIGAAITAAPAQAATAKQSPHPEYDKGFSDGWNQCEARQAAAPAQAGEYPELPPLQVRYDGLGHTTTMGYGVSQMRDYADATCAARGAALATPAQPLHVAATSCPHEIDKDKIVLHFDSKQPGKNALAQLAARLQAAQVQDARKPLTDDQIEAAREAAFSTNNPFCPVDRKAMLKAARAIEVAHGITEPEAAVSP